MAHFIKVIIPHSYISPLTPETLIQDIQNLERDNIRFVFLKQNKDEHNDAEKYTEINQKLFDLDTGISICNLGGDVLDMHYYAVVDNMDTDCFFEEGKSWTRWTEENQRTVSFINDKYYVPMSTPGGYIPLSQTYNKGDLVLELPTEQ